MTIQLDNGTTIELTEDIIRITNGDRGFTWNMQEKMIYRTTDTVEYTEINNNVRAILSKMVTEMDIMLGYLYDCMESNDQPDCDPFRGLLIKKDLSVDRDILSKHIFE